MPISAKFGGGGGLREYYDVYIMCMYGHTYSKSMINRVGCQSCSWSAEQGKRIFPCPRTRLKTWSCDVCMYGHTYSKSMDQPGKVASPARGQLNRKNEYVPVRVHA